MTLSAPALQTRRASATAATPAAACPANLDRVVCAFLTAQEFVIERGFGLEVDLQDAVTRRSLSEATFLREAAWVVLSAGMSERAVRARFSRVAESFLEFNSAEAIDRNRHACIGRAIAAFNYPRKIEAIAGIAHMVATRGFANVHAALLSDGVHFLQSLDFIGPVTSFHLAKNLGLDVVKPDRHLVRVAQSLGFSDPHSLCTAIAWRTGDRLATVDLVFWRYATLVKDYCKKLNSLCQPRSPNLDSTSESEHGRSRSRICRGSPGSRRSPVTAKATSLRRDNVR